MSFSVQKISKNTGLLTVSLIVQKILSFIYFSYLATQLGVEQTGLYFFAISLTSIFSVFIDFGIINALIRQVASQDSEQTDFINTALRLRIVLAVLMYIVLLSITLIFNYDLATIKVVMLAGLVMIIDAFTLFLYGILRGLHITKYEAFGNILFQVILLIIGFSVINYKPLALYAFIALLIASLSNLIYALWQTRKKINLLFFRLKNKITLRKVVLVALPFALAGIFSRIYGYLDTFLLKTIIDNTAVGYYSLPYKITFVFQFIPLALMAAIYPAFSHLYNKDKEKLTNTFHNSVKYLLVIVLPITAGIFLLAKPIYLHIYGVEYFPSIIAQQILIFALPFVFINFPLGYLLNACHLQKQNTINIFIAMIISIVANIVLIPHYQYIAAALVSVLTSLILMILNLYFVAKKIINQWQILLTTFTKLLIATILMSIFIYLTIPYLHYIIITMMAALIYGLLLFILKIFKWQDLINIYQLLNNHEK